MRVLRLGSIVALAVLAWLGPGAALDGALSAGPSMAAAQGTLTPPAGQPRVTAPGGRGARRHRKFRRSFAHRHRGH